MRLCGVVQWTHTRAKNWTRVTCTHACIIYIYIYINGYAWVCMQRCAYMILYMYVLCLVMCTCTYWCPRQSLSRYFVHESLKVSMCECYCKRKWCARLRTCIVWYTMWYTLYWKNVLYVRMKAYMSSHWVCTLCLDCI